ncbi:MAG: arsenical pump rane protein [Rhodospirillales bacterium]|nr:arsenical pump rane protein [Rhodospirillales bacterium]
MIPLTKEHLAIWAVAGLATVGVIARPWRLPEAVWAVLGAVLLVGLGLMPWDAALSATARGGDVYLFLVGMMLLAELARREGLFDTLAAQAVHHSEGSATRLFGLIYAVGILVTTFLSNDATAVVLTPAVYVAAKAAKAEPLPYLLICAFIANAASFVLPISNPANLVLFGSHMPPLAVWLARFTLPSVLSIAATFVVLWLTQRSALRQNVARYTAVLPMTRGGWLTLYGICATAVILLAASALGAELGLPTFIAGALTAAVVLVLKHEAPWPVLRGVSWSVLPLVAGLFMLVESVNRTGVTQALASAFAGWSGHSATEAALGGGALIAVAANLMNNLPTGLIASSALAQVMVPDVATSALMIGVDLGPNLSITGSLATILWLLALRREGQAVGFWGFLKLGALVMPPALLLALAGLLATS